MAYDLIGQGNPLPQGFPYQGEWLTEPRIFLYLPTQPQSATTDLPQFAVELNITSENWSFGLDATAMATQLGVSVDDLFAANRNETLKLEKVESDTPTGENSWLKVYTFSLNDRIAKIEYHRFPQVGHA